MTRFLACSMLVGCSPAPSEGPETLPECHPVNVPTTVCDPSVASFGLASTNPWYPLIPGSVVELRGIGEGDEAGIAKHVVRTVSEETRTVFGVEVHQLRHETYHDDVIHEIAVNFYVEASDGTVCYFGEEVEFYEDGVLANRDGTWTAGVDGAMPGVIMPADPQVGDAYYQENAPGLALDQGRVTDVGLVTEIGGEAYDTIRVVDTNPIDDETPCAEEEKRYAAGIGEIVDTVLDVVSFTP